MIDSNNQRRSRKRGDVVICRYVGLGRTFVAVTATVDHDDDRSTGVYLAPGAPERQVRRADGSFIPRVVPPGYWEREGVTMEDGIHGGGPTLVVWQPARAHAVHVHWRAETWKPDGFYVNLQEPMIVTADGFATTDHFLDIVVDADLNWAWKDEDELEEAVAVGRLTIGAARAVRSEGDRVVASIEARHWPFDGSFDTWRPDPAWPIPEIPADWNDE